MTQPKPKEWPLIFIGHSVRQTLAGKKWMTRRLVGSRMWSVDGGPWPRGWKFDLANARLDHGPSPGRNEGPYLHAQRVGADTIHRLYPLVQVGDRIRGRETWAAEVNHLCGPVGSCDCDDVLVTYAADGQVRHISASGIPADWTIPKRGNVSPIFMPRWASRLVREVVDRRVERLQQISEEDAVAEGVISSLMRAGGEEQRLWQADEDGHAWCDTARQAFRYRWDDLHVHGPPNDPPLSLVSWVGNPWVLALTYGKTELTDG